MSDPDEVDSHDLLARLVLAEATLLTALHPELPEREDADYVLELAYKALAAGRGGGVR